MKSNAMPQRKTVTEEKEPILYLQCIFCGKTHPLKSVREETLDSVEPLRWKVLQVREQKGGYGVGGFFLIPGKSLTIQQMLEKPEYKDIAEGIKTRLLKLVAAYRKIGLLTKEELE